MKRISIICLLVVLVAGSIYFIVKPSIFKSKTIHDVAEEFLVMFHDCKTGKDTRNFKDAAESFYKKYNMTAYSENEDASIEYMSFQIDGTEAVFGAWHRMYERIWCGILIYDPNPKITESICDSIINKAIENEIIYDDGVTIKGGGEYHAKVLKDSRYQKPPIHISFESLNCNYRDFK